MECGYEYMSKDGKLTNNIHLPESHYYILEQQCFNSKPEAMNYYREFKNSPRYNYEGYGRYVPYYKLVNGKWYIVYDIEG